MKYWVVFIVVLCVLLLCAERAWRLCHPYSQEPSYGGRSLSEWLDAQFQPSFAGNPSLEVRANAIRMMGTNAVPFLLKRLAYPGSPPPWWKSRLLYWPMRQAGIHVRHAVWGLERGETGREGFLALRPFAKQVVPVLIATYRGCKEGDPYRVAVTDALARLGPSAQEAVPFLLGEVQHTNACLRSCVFGALQMVHPEADIGVPLFTKGLEDPDIEVRRISARGLEDYGVEAREAVPSLWRFVEREEAAMNSDRLTNHRPALYAGRDALQAIMGTSGSAGSSGEREPPRVVQPGPLEGTGGQVPNRAEP